MANDISALREPAELPRWAIITLSIVAGALGLAGLAALGVSSYPLFHSLAELLCISIAWGVFGLAWGARRYRHTDNGYILLLGISLLFVGILDFVHTLTYRGIAMFVGYDADLPTQLWISARYVQSLSFLAAFALLVTRGASWLTRPRAPLWALLGYALITGLLLAACFGRVFPPCYIEGVGLTPFKCVSEYVIAGLLVLAMALLWWRRERLEREASRWLLGGLLAATIAELVFTYYVDVTDTINMTGHLFKVLAYVCFYRAIVLTGIERPQALLFRALTASEVQYRHLAENTRDYVLRYDRAHRHVYANPAAIAATGTTEAEFIGHTHRELGFPEHLCDLWERGIDRVFATGQPYGEVFVWDGPSGPVTLDWRLAPEVEHGQVETVLAVSRDITAIVAAEKALRTREAELAAIYENAPLIMVLVGTDGRVQRANRYALTYAGANLKEMMALPAGMALKCANAIYDEENYGLGPRCEGCRLRQMMLDTLATGASHFQAPVRLPFTLEGELQWRDLLISTTRLDVAGEPLALVSMLDITARVQAETALKASEALLKETQRLARLGGWELDAATGRVTWTEETYRIHEVPLGFEPAVASALDFYAPGDRAILEQALQRATVAGEPYDLELQFVTAQGRRLWVRTTGAAEWGEGHAAKLSGTFQDITARKQAELALQQAHDELERRVQERTQQLTAANVELQALSSAERRQRELAETLAATSLALTRSLSLDEVLKTLLAQLDRLVTYDSAAVLLPQDAVRWAVQAARGYEGWPDAPDIVGLALSADANATLGELLAEHRSVLATRGSTARGNGHPLGIAQAQSWLSVPLVVGEQVIGLCLLDKAAPDSYSAEHVFLVEAIAGQVAVAVQNAWLFEEVRAGRERLQALTRRLVEVQETERRYIARELHDEAGQALTSLNVGLRLLEREAHQPEAVVAGAADLRRRLDEVLENLHRLAIDLRPASLDYVGLVAALQQYAEAITAQTGLTVELEAVNLQRLPLEMETALYRIAQEALTNVVRHAQATRVDVLLMQERDMITLMVEDNGVGFDPENHDASGRLGLLGIRERVEMLGGTLLLESAPGAGVTLRVQVPLVGGR